MGHIETDDPMEDVVYQDDDISPINEVIEIEQITSQFDIAVKGQQVDVTIFLSKNHVDEEHEEFEYENNIRLYEDNEVCDDTLFQ